jgi:hypothetical protein
MKVSGWPPHESDCGFRAAPFAVLRSRGERLSLVACHPAGECSLFNSLARRALEGGLRWAVVRERSRPRRAGVSPGRHRADRQGRHLSDPSVQRIPGYLGADQILGRVTIGSAMELAGRSALVTGGAGGLGGATVRHLVGLGMFVTIFDQNASGGADLADELGGKAVAVFGDVTEDGDVDAAVNAARSHGPLSLLVNVAGGGVRSQRTMSRDFTPHDKGAFLHTCR